VVARKANEVTVAPLVESGLAGVWSQAVGFVLVRLTGIWLQSLQEDSTFKLLHKVIF
jgi:hypothetical protein